MAARSGISVQRISNLERADPHVPRRDTLQLLTQDQMRQFPDPVEASFATSLPADGPKKSGVIRHPRRLLASFLRDGKLASFMPFLAAVMTL